MDSYIQSDQNTDKANISICEMIEFQNVIDKASNYIDNDLDSVQILLIGLSDAG